jgi:hypothetical protein
VIDPDRSLQMEGNWAALTTSPLAGGNRRVEVKLSYLLGGQIA